MASLPSHEAVLRENADCFLNRLLDAPAATRRPMLDALRTADPELFTLVDSLFAHFDEVGADDEAAGFLAQPLEPPPPDGADDAGEDVIGMRFGHWQVVKPIGRGGMGLVFAVERSDGVVRQRAALKLIKRSNDHRSIVARFHIERQILAQLDHPSIARLIDAGAADDRPYLVMEYVDGVPLDRWCDEHALSIDARIELFNRICSAVHYAHQRLVVHRDLKPSNILITADGTPKLLDFGISKLIDADGGSAASAETIDASALLTPRYASPEQLTGAPISTASDVYTLGVLLFELLTGTGPYRPRNDTIVEMMRVVANETAMRVSLAASDEKLARRLRGDLDLIVGKALERQPAERYESVAALRDDLVHHLEGDAIKAAPASWRYRATKFVTKHRTAVTATAVFVVVLAGLAIVASWEALRAERALVVADEQRARAEQRFEDTRSLAKAMLSDVNDAIAIGPTKAREQLVRTALTYLDRLSQDRLTPELEGDVAAGYQRIAEILGSDTGSNLGREAEAKAYAVKALAIRDRIYRDRPADQENITELVDLNMTLGLLSRSAGDPVRAADHFHDAVRFASARAAADPENAKAFLAVFIARRQEAAILFMPGVTNLNLFDEALKRYRSLVTDIETYAEAHPKSRSRVLIYLNTVVYDVNRLMQFNGDAAMALTTARRSLEISERSAADKPDNPYAMMRLSNSLQAVGEALSISGDDAGAIAILKRALGLRADLLKNDPASASAESDVAEAFGLLGVAYQQAGRLREALAQYELWTKHAEIVSKAQPDSIAGRLDLQQARWHVADMHVSLGQIGKSLPEARQVERAIESLDGAARGDRLANRALGEARLLAARSLVGSSAEESFALMLRGLQSLEINEMKTPEDVTATRDAAIGRIQAGKVGLGSRDAQTRACALIVDGRDRLHALDEQSRLGVPFRPALAEGQREATRCVALGSSSQASSRRLD